MPPWKHLVWVRKTLGGGAPDVATPWNLTDRSLTSSDEELMHRDCRVGHYSFIELLDMSRRGSARHVGAVTSKRRSCQRVGIDYLNAER